MRRVRVAGGILTSTVTMVVLVLPARAQGVPPRVTSEQVMSWMEDLSNWGRWGPDDQLGTLNFITPEKRREAAALVQGWRRRLRPPLANPPWPAPPRRGLRPPRASGTPELARPGPTGRRRRST